MSDFDPELMGRKIRFVADVQKAGTARPRCGATTDPAAVLADPQCECSHPASAHEHGKRCVDLHYVEEGNYFYHCFCTKCPHEVALAQQTARIEAVGGALEEAGFTPLGDDYASSVEAMSRGYENAKGDLSQQMAKVEALRDYCVHKRTCVACFGSPLSDDECSCGLLAALQDAKP